jgi:hypothetical protein
VNAQLSSNGGFVGARLLKVDVLHVLGHRLFVSASGKGSGECLAFFTSPWRPQ